MIKTSMASAALASCLTLSMGLGLATSHAQGLPPTLSQSAPLLVSAPAGQARAGRIIDVKIRSPRTGDTVAFTLLEPRQFVAGQRYPLVLHGHGFSASRYTGRGTSPTELPVISQILGDAPGIEDLLNNGYAVVSFDQRGHGQSSGNIRVMDPDADGQNILALLDWLEGQLPWLARGLSADGTDPNNLILGAMGGSYGGMYQLMLTFIDPKHRLDAIAPEIAPHSLPQSLAPESVPKTLWDVALLGLGSTAGLQTASSFDPFVIQGFTQSFASNRFTPGLQDFMAYHSTSYWCNGVPVATNGGPGTKPGYPPLPTPRINALVVQGMRDVLFNFNEGFGNQQCLSKGGGDVRFLTTQTGHNAIPVVPDPGAFAFQNPQDQYSSQCGRVTTRQARLAFFDEHLKGIKGAADAVPRQTCLSLSGPDAVLVDKVTVGKAGTRFVVPSTPVVAGLAAIPAVIKLGAPTGGRGEVVAGIPHLKVNVSPATPLALGEPILFAGLGVVHTSGAIELIDNQVQPLRGLGQHDVDLVGVGKRLPPGSQLALLVYGAQEQFAATGSLSLNVAKATVMPVRVSGEAWAPLIGVLNPAP